MSMSVAAVRAAVQRSGVRDMLDEEAKEAGTASKYAGIWFYEQGRSTSSFRGSPSWSAVVQAAPQAAGGKPPKQPEYGDQPFFVVHGLESEEEAALAHDYATLWLRLRTRGCTPASLSSQAWNLPQMRVWEDAGLRKHLRQYSVEGVRVVEKYVKSKVRDQLPAMSEKGLLPKKRVQELKRQQKRREEWREEVHTRQYGGKAKAKASRPAAAPAGRLTKKDLAQWAAEMVRQQARADAKQAEAQARVAQAKAAVQAHRAAELKKRRAEKEQQRATARKRQAADAAEASRQQKRQRLERHARRGGKRLAPG